MRRALRWSELVCVAFSIGAHAWIAIALVMLPALTAVSPQPGEVDVTLELDGAGPAGGSAGGSPLAMPTPPPSPPSPPESPSPEPSTADTPTPAPIARPRPPPPPAPMEAAPSATEGTGDGDSEGEGQGAGTTLGTGSVEGAGDTVGAGSADAPRCGDPVNGRWVGFMYFSSQGYWSRVLLTLAREGDRVRGTIVNQEWRGPRRDPTPRTCEDGVPAWQIRMPARGAVHDLAIEIRGTSYEVLPGSCWMDIEGYNVDRFAGTIDVEHERLDLVWYDDEVLLNGRPIHFHRLGCEP